MNVTVSYTQWDTNIVVKAVGTKWEACVADENSGPILIDNHALRFEGDSQDEALAGLVAIVYSWGQWLRRKREVAL